MMKNLFSRCYNILILLSFLPYVYGCNEGGASSGAVSGLAGTGGTVSSVIPAAAGTGDTLALHAPEPATMLMVGTGILAWRLMTRRAK